MDKSYWQLYLVLLFWNNQVKGPPFPEIQKKGGKRLCGTILKVRRSRRRLRLRWPPYRRPARLEEIADNRSYIVAMWQTPKVRPGERAVHRPLYKEVITGRERLSYEQQSDSLACVSHLLGCAVAGGVAAQHKLLGFSLGVFVFLWSVFPLDCIPRFC